MTSLFRFLSIPFLIAGATTGLSARASDTNTNEALEQPSASKNLSELSLEELTEVRVTTIGTGTPKAVTETPAVTTIITAREIELMGAGNLMEVLDTVPGMHVSMAGESYTPKFLIRGITSQFNPETLAIINGVPLADSLHNGSFPVSMISRIEIIRGPGSALYGADAFAGVLNVVTKDQSEIQGYLAGARAGSFNTQQVWFQHGQRYGDLNLVLMGDYLTTDGHKREITADAQTKLDSDLGTHASLAPGPVNLSRKRLELFMDMSIEHWRLRGRYESLTNQGTGQGVSEALDPYGRTSEPRTTADLTYNNSKLARDWDFTSQLAYGQASLGAENNIYLYPPGANLGNGTFPNGVIGKPRESVRQAQFNNSAVFTGIARHRFRLGAGFYYYETYQITESKNFSPDFAPLPGLIDVTGTPDAYNHDENRKSFYVFLQDEWKFSEQWELTAGARFDYYSDFGGTTNPRIALVWKTTPLLTTKFLYGRAFRSPSLTELHEANNPVALGNPNVKPETINVLELALTYGPVPERQIGLNFYHYEVNDLIEFVPDSSGLSATAQNQGKQNGNGIELDAKWKLIEKLAFTGNYSLQRSTFESTGSPVGFYPNQRAYARIDWNPAENWFFSAQDTWIGKRDRQAGDSRPPLRGYTTVDLILRRKNIVLKDFSLMATVRNLFDRDIREPSYGPGSPSGVASIPNDLPQAGRSFYAEANYHF